MESRDSKRVVVEDAIREGVRPGESLTLTAGVERYPQPNGGHVDVGPIAVTLVVQPGEDSVAVYKRARTMLEVLFTAECELKLSNYGKRG